MSGQEVKTKREREAKTDEKAKRKTPTTITPTALLEMTESKRLRLLGTVPPELLPKLTNELLELQKKRLMACFPTNHELEVAHDGQFFFQCYYCDRLDEDNGHADHLKDIFVKNVAKLN
jgi:hypothetical protein